MNNTEKAKQYETKELLERMKKFLAYDPWSGNIVFTDNRFGAKKIGQVAGYTDKGYIRLYHRGRQFMAHRVAWALCQNKWPEHTIDHIDKDGTNNKWENLRDVTQAENNKNKGPYKTRIITNTL